MSLLHAGPHRVPSRDARRVAVALVAALGLAAALAVAGAAVSQDRTRLAESVAERAAGDELGFVVAGSSPGRNDALYVGSWDGKVRTRVFWGRLGGSYHVAWSPDGRRLAFEGASGNLWIVDAATKGRRRFRVGDDWGLADQPWLTPDRVIYETAGRCVGR